MHRNVFAIALLTLAILGLAAGPSLAHRVNIFAWVEGGTVRTESQFAKDRPVRGGTVKVFAQPSGRQPGAPLLTGTTDDRGRFDFPLPANAGSALRIALDLGDGHAAEWQLELPAWASDPQVTSDAPAPEPAAAQKPAASPTRTSDPQLEQMVEQAVDRALERRLTPLVDMLARQQHAGPGFKEIFGGIGWLVGLAGIAAWFSCRSKARP